MKIEKTKFGSIWIEGEKYNHDVVLYPDGIEKRKKSITKNKHGTSHKFTREEMEEYLRKVDTEKIDLLVVGTGQYGKLYLLPETKKLLEEKGIKAVELETPDAIKRFNQEGKARNLGIFHVTC